MRFAHVDRLWLIEPGGNVTVPFVLCVTSRLPNNGMPNWYTFCSAAESGTTTSK